MIQADHALASLREHFNILELAELKVERETIFTQIFVHFCRFLFYFKIIMKIKIKSFGFSFRLTMLSELNLSVEILQSIYFNHN